MKRFRLRIAVLLLLLALLCSLLHPAVQSLLVRTVAARVQPGVEVRESCLAVPDILLVRGVSFSLPEYGVTSGGVDGVYGTTRIAGGPVPAGTLCVDGFRLDYRLPEKTGASGGARPAVLTRLPARVVFGSRQVQARVFGFAFASGSADGFLATRSAEERDLHLAARGILFGRAGGAKPLLAADRFTAVLRTREEAGRFSVKPVRGLRIWAHGLHGQDVEVARAGIRLEIEETPGDGGPRSEALLEFHDFDCGKWTKATTSPNIYCSGLLSGSLRLAVEGTTIRDFEGEFHSGGSGALRLRKEALAYVAASVFQGLRDPEIQKAVLEALREYAYSTVSGRISRSNKELVVRVQLKGRGARSSGRIDLKRLPMSLEITMERPETLMDLYKLYNALIRRRTQ